MSERETPETDELWSRDRGSESLLAHARKLERERDEAREALFKAATELQVAASNFSVLTRGTGGGRVGYTGQLIKGHPFEERAMDASMEAMAQVHNLRTRAEACANSLETCTQPPTGGPER